MKTVAERFWAKVDKSGPTVRAELGPCWLWTGKRHPDGYGLLHTGTRKTRREMLAHRVAWEVAFGAIVPVADATTHGTCVLHRCDNPRCVNAAHLFLGTQVDNIRDRDTKGRRVSSPGARNGTHTMPERRPTGESHGMSILTENDVREIRARRAQGQPLKTIANLYGVGLSTVSDITLRKRWRHVA